MIHSFSELDLFSHVIFPNVMKFVRVNLVKVVKLKNRLCVTLETGVLRWKNYILEIKNLLQYKLTVIRITIG